MEKHEYAKIYKKRQQEMATRIDNLSPSESEWFWVMTSRQLRWYIYKFSQNAEDMDEILSLTINKIILGKSSYDPSKALFTSWCHRIAHNEAINYMFLKTRDFKRSVKIDDEDEHLQLVDDWVEDENPERVDILHKIVLEEIEKLNPKLKPVAIRYLLNGDRQEDIAHDLGINLNTLKTRVRYAKTIISQKILKSHENLVY